MIFIQRPTPPGTFLEYPLRILQLEQINNWFSTPPDERGHQPITPRWTDVSDIVQMLRTTFANKCAFCETKLDKQPDELLLTHFRPPERALQEKGGIADSDHYRWLCWEWSNLYLACQICKREKGEIFPIDQRRAVRNTYGNKLLVEEPSLLDPCSDDPSKHLQFTKTGKVIPKEESSRGRITIDTLALNRESLLTARADSAQYTLELLQQSLHSTTNTAPQINELKMRCQSDHPFAGMSRQLIRDWLRVSPTPSDVPHWQELIRELDDYELTISEDETAFNSCFISYSNKNFEFGERLRSDLDIKGVGYWFASEHMKIGDRIHDTIIQAINNSDKLLVILSSASVRSRWVKMEVEEALKIERNEDRRILFPISIDKAVMDQKDRWVATKFKDRHIGDFCRWKNERAYRRALDRLLRDLKR